MTYMGMDMDMDMDAHGSVRDALLVARRLCLGVTHEGCQLLLLWLGRILLPLIGLDLFGRFLEGALDPIPRTIASVEKWKMLLWSGRAEGGRWRAAGGGWRVEGGGRRAEGGGRRAEGGGRKVEGEAEG